MASKNVLQVIHGHTSDILSLDFFGNSMLVTGSSDKSVRLWRWQAGNGFVEDPNSPFLAHKYSVTKVQFSPKGHVIASSSLDGSIILWSLEGEKTEIIYQLNGESIRNFVFSPNGDYITSSDDSGNVCIYDQNKSMKKVLKNHEMESVHALAYSCDSKILMTACCLGNIRLYYLSDLEAETTEPDCLIDNAHDMGVFSGDFCKIVKNDPLDSTTKIYTLATGGNDHIIKIWRIYCATDVNHSRKNSTVENATSRGSRLIPRTPQEHFSGTSTIYCTKYMNAQCVNTIQAHGSSVTCVKFNNSGSLLVTSGLDRLVKIFNMQGICMKTLAEHKRYVNCVTINTDSTLLASGSNDKTIIIWDLTNSFTLNTHISTGLKSLLYTLAANKVDIPQDFICPITHEIMSDPVLLEDGFAYEKTAILEWFSIGRKTSPMTNMDLSTMEVFENTKLKMEIETYLKSMDPFE